MIFVRPLEIIKAIRSSTIEITMVPVLIFRPAFISSAINEIRRIITGKTDDTIKLKNMRCLKTGRNENPFFFIWPSGKIFGKSTIRFKISIKI